MYYSKLGGGFKYFYVHPLFGEGDPILTSIFFKWVGSTTNQERFHTLDPPAPISILDLYRNTYM